MTSRAKCLVMVILKVLPDSENEGICLEDFENLIGFSKSFCPVILKNTYSQARNNRRGWNNREGWTL